VDNWRRKTTIQLTTTNPNNNNLDPIQLSGQSTTNIVEAINPTPLLQKDNTDSLAIQLIQNNADLNQSKAKRNKNSLSIAKLFLYELNDFEKALPRYQEVIQHNIDPNATESALLDLASHYLHIGQPTRSDSIIQIITQAFPEGSYLQKKNAKENIENINKNSSEAYSAAYFTAQIGDWDQFSAQMETAQQLFKGTKWNTPYQFLKVKMNAQQGKDSLAIDLLNQIITQNKSEAIKARAKDIITEINNRKATEAYLAALKIEKPKKIVNMAQEAIEKTKGPSIAIKHDSSLNSTGKINAMASENANQITFSNDSLEQHYIALQTMNVSTVFVKEIQNAFKDVNAEDFRKLNLAVTFVQFTDQSHIIWIGPFTNASEGLAYLKQVKPRLSTEIISFVAKNQYDLTLIGKSNIIQINNQEQLNQYKRDKSNYYFKP
jgi:hypothetical protein